MLAHVDGSVAFKADGNSVEQKHHVLASVDAAERLHHHFYLGRALSGASWFSYGQGEWEAAREYSDRALAASP